MSLAGCTALFLLLGAIALGQTQDCNFPNITANSDHYNMSISQNSLSNNTLYTVTVLNNGNENVQVLFSAVETTKKTAVGSWSLEGHANCSGRPLLDLKANSSVAAHWTSPSSIPKSVDIQVNITNTTVTYTKSITLENAASSIQSLSLFLTLGLLVIVDKFL